MDLQVATAKQIGDRVFGSLISDNNNNLVMVMQY
jgi:hypothetical protein